jgi:hypothetical protein
MVGNVEYSRFPVSWPGALAVKLGAHLHRRFASGALRGMDLKARLGFLLDYLLSLNLRGPSCQSQKQRI